MQAYENAVKVRYIIKQITNLKMFLTKTCMNLKILAFSTRISKCF